MFKIFLDVVKTLKSCGSYFFSRFFEDPSTLSRVLLLVLSLTVTEKIFGPQIPCYGSCKISLPCNKSWTLRCKSVIVIHVPILFLQKVYTSLSVV